MPVVWGLRGLCLQFEGLCVVQFSPLCSFLNFCPLLIYRYLLPSNVDMVAVKFLRELWLNISAEIALDCVTNNFNFSFGSWSPV